MKAKKEINEIEDDMQRGLREKLAEEYADVIICVFASAAKNELTALEVFEAIEKKMTVNYTRQWLKQEDGTYQHVKDNPFAPKRYQLEDADLSDQEKSKLIYGEWDKPIPMETDMRTDQIVEYNKSIEKDEEGRYKNKPYPPL